MTAVGAVVASGNDDGVAAAATTAVFGFAVAVTVVVVVVVVVVDVVDVVDVGGEGEADTERDGIV